MNPMLLRATIVAALGGLLFGFDTAVISGTTAWLVKVYDLSKFWEGFTVAAALAGTIVGAILVGRPSDRFGRRPVLMAIALLYLISAVGTAFPWDWYSFMFFRFVGGLAVGGASVVAPTYITEISPPRYRGRLVAFTQFNIVFGILLAYLSNYIIAQFGLGEVEWRWMFGVEAIPAAAFFLLLFTTPESPRWLIAQRRVNEGSEVLARLGNEPHQVETLVGEIRQSLEAEHHSLEEPFFRRAYRTPMLLAVAIAAFNQLSGINALLYYAPQIFAMAGADKDSALLQSVAVGVTNLVFTMLAMTIIDYSGRRRLMLVGSIGYIVSLATTAWAFYYYGNQFTPTGGVIMLVSLLAFIASHAFGQGAVIWVFLGEIFPNQVRARGQALGSFTHWFMAALITWTFPVIAKHTGGYVFAFYALMMVLQLLWVIFVMPETKGVPLEEIQKKLGIE
jgi:sugar porter (SP) family MFS transporter